jgi:hypothetical protein
MTPDQLTSVSRSCYVRARLVVFLKEPNTPWSWTGRTVFTMSVLAPFSVKDPFMNRLETKLKEREVAGQGCLFIPVRGVPCEVKPADIDTWSRLSQIAAAAQRRCDGEADLADYGKSLNVKGQRFYMLALGDALPKLRIQRPGREWIEAASLIAFHWHLSGIDWASRVWDGFLGELERNGYGAETW